MQELGIKAPNANLKDLGIETVQTAHWNLNPSQLIEKILKRKEGELTNVGAIAINTGEFTGRSPKDRFVVCDSKTEDSVWWGDINFKFDPEKFDQLHQKITAYLADKEVFVKDVVACADEKYQLKIRTVTELPLSALFVDNMFLRLSEKQLLKAEKPEWSIICAPKFKANPEIDGTRQSNFAVINFTKQMIIIGGTGYTGEIKKGIFSVLNYILPHDKKVLSMHCSANVGAAGDTAVFFGLSGTGKTTLSADPKRGLIGDDEHGWSEDAVFNFEGGCYAKTIDLTEEKEPQIYKAIKYGAIVENTKFFEGTREVNYEDISITQNTRTSYPIHHIDNAIEPSRAAVPKNIFFLTADAFGVIPPISKLTPGQAMYHFISGYTAKVAGTEVGVNEPQATFSACFGAAFLPLHPTKYAELLGKKMQENNVNVWLVNTGWTGGPFGVGNRMKLKFTRAMITAALEGKLNDVAYKNHPVFGVAVPQTCPNVPDEVLNPRETWADKAAYDEKVKDLAERFNKNFEAYSDQANAETLAGAPKI